MRPLECFVRFWVEMRVRVFERTGRELHIHVSSERAVFKVWLDLTKLACAG